MSSGIMDKTYLSIIASANLALEAVRQLEESQIDEVVALCRPPGHHCNGHKAGGYCYVNNAAVAISEWRRHSPEAKIGILDVDFHHGNGTQDLFYSDPRTFYTSIHGEDEFPYYTGTEDECGEGQAIGTNLNLPLATGSSFDQYLEKLELALSALSKHEPEFLLVSLGLDTFHLDPLGNFKIDTEDYETMARIVRQRLPSVPAVILLEGGYALEHLGNNLLSFLNGWD
jgi:acetoin utilization deacetylase AcuC-like enzyme